MGHCGGCDINRRTSETDDCEHGTRHGSVDTGKRREIESYKGLLYACSYSV